MINVSFSLVTHKFVLQHFSGNAATRQNSADIVSEMINTRQQWNWWKHRSVDLRRRRETVWWCLYGRTNGRDRSTASAAQLEAGRHTSLSPACWGRPQTQYISCPAEVRTHLSCVWFTTGTRIAQTPYEHHAISPHWTACTQHQYRSFIWQRLLNYPSLRWLADRDGIQLVTRSIPKINNFVEKLSAGWTERESSSISAVIH